MKQIYIYLLICVLLYLIYRKNMLHFDSNMDMPIYIPRSDISIGNVLNNVPLNIFLTWNTKDLPNNMKNNIILLHKMNPEFNIYLYDEQDRIDFIKNNYSQDVLDAYNSLLPGAFRADIWRYCVIYKYGGVYMDIKYFTSVPLIELIKKSEFNFPIEKTSLCNNNINYIIQNGFFISSPNNNVFKEAIDQAVMNCKNKYYGTYKTSITGPCMFTGTMNKVYPQDMIDKITTMTWLPKQHNDMYYFKNTNILIASRYEDYRHEQHEYFKHNKITDYFAAWIEKKVFK